MQVLDLSANQLMRPGVLAVARALAARGGSFELLSLDENAITDNGVEQLRGVLKVSIAVLLVQKVHVPCMLLRGLWCSGSVFYAGGYPPIHDHMQPSCQACLVFALVVCCCYEAAQQQPLQQDSLPCSLN